MTRPRTIAELKRQIKEQERKLARQRARIEEKLVIAQNLGPLARARRGFKQRGGISGISTKAQQQLELKARSFLGKQARHFIRELRGIHSNPVAFVNLLAGNKRLTKEQKLKAFKTYVRRHGRRSSTLD